MMCVTELPGSRRPRALFSRAAMSAVGLLLCFALVGCGEEPAATAGVDGGGTDTSTPSEFVATPADFPCLADDQKVGQLYIRNPISKALEDEAVALATSNETGKEYPVGTIIRLIPREAMVKRGASMTETAGWEFINLAEEATGTVTIKERGGKEITNQAGSCWTCHAPAKDYDYICKKTNGCGTLEKFGVTDALIGQIQGSDSLCKK